MNCCNDYGECTRVCNCPARESGPIKPLRQKRSALVDKLITAGQYAVTLAALICVAMAVGALIGVLS